MGKYLSEYNSYFESKGHPQPKSSSLFKSPDVEESFNNYSEPKKKFLSKYSKALYSSLGRSPEENLNAGGVPTSKHLTDDAADVSYRGGDVDTIERDIKSLGGKALRESDHLHIEFPEGFDGREPKRSQFKSEYDEYFKTAVPIPEEPRLIDKAREGVLSLNDSLNAGRQKAAEFVGELPGRITSSLGLDADQPPSEAITKILGPKASKFAQNFNRGLVDVGVGFPAQVVSSTLSAPEEIKGYIEDPKSLVEGAKTGLEMVAAPFDPREYTADKFFEDPVGRLANLGTAIGVGSGAAKSFKSLKKVPKEATLPEAPETLGLQVESLAKGRSPALLITPGEAMPEIPRYSNTLKTDLGTWVYDPLKISEKTIKAKVQDGTYGELLGHVEPKSSKATQTVLAEQGGVEARGSLVSPENVPVQAEILKKQFPEAEIKVGGPELAEKVIQKRQFSDLLKDAFSDVLEPLASERGSISTKKADTAVFQKANEARAEIFKRLKDESGRLGEALEDTAKRYGITPDKLQVLVQKQGESQGDVLPFKDINPQFSPTKYVSDMMKQREASRAGKIETTKNKAVNFYNEMKVKLVDSNAPIEDLIALSQKHYKYEVLPKYDITNQIDRTLRAPTIAGQFIKDSGFDKVIRDVPDLNALDQYVIARHGKTLRAKGIETGRDPIADTQLMSQLGPQYEPYAKRVTDFARKLLDYCVDSGLISKSLADELKTAYPDYVPLNRVFSEMEKSGGQLNSRAMASLSKQSVVQRIVGSKREIESPIKSLLEKTTDAFIQGEKNKAARILAGYKDLPGFKGLIKELPKGEGAAHTFSYLDNGVKKTFETTPEIAAAAKALNVQQLNILGKILAFPVRIARLGITGVNPPFVAANLVKDQVSSFINSRHGLKTSVANPKVFLEAIFNAVKHGDLYEEMVRQGASGTSFDISRNQIPQTIKKIRASKSMGGKIKYTVRHPGELFRALENMIGRGEEATRLQQFIGTKRALLKEGRTPEDANILGAKASRENSANFARRGEWGNVLNGAILYLNAGIQGSRSFVRSLERTPVKTVAKVAISIFAPVAIATSWNLSDPKRKEVYEDIEDYEKENNIIYIPPNPTMDDKGAYNVIKIPMPPGISSLAGPVRKGVEQANGLDPVRFSDFAHALFSSVSPVEPTANKALSTLTPQAIKPTLEGFTNKNFFTGKDQVPEFLQERPTEAQVYPWTSGTAKKIGKPLEVSPIKVENFIKGTLGGVGSQTLNISDKILSKLGIIGEDEIGGQDTLEAITARFNKARGGRQKRLAKEREERGRNK